MRLEEKNGEFLRSKVGLTWELETSRSLNFYDGIIFTHDVSDQQAVNINHFPLWMFGVMTDFTKSSILPETEKTVHLHSSEWKKH